MTTGLSHYVAFSYLNGSKVLPCVIKASGDTILSALLRMREKVGKCSVVKTEIRRYEFQQGGFRVVLPVSKRTIRKYIDGGNSILNDLNIVTN